MAQLKGIDFREATRSQAKASIVIQGLSGKGKSGLALLLAYTLAGADWSKVFANDTENRSLDLFEGIRMNTGDQFGKFKKFDLLSTHGYRPSNYVAIKEAAKQAGAEVFINDSITHCWQGKGGVLQLVAAKEAASTKLNKYNAWGEPEVAAEKDAIYELIRDPEMHMISTVRVKEKFDIVQGEGLKSLGEQQQQMPDLKYEPDLVLDMVQSGNTSGRAPSAKVIKSRYAIFSEGEVYTFDQDTLAALKQYLEEGVDPEILLEQQRQDFIKEIKATLDASPSKLTLWSLLKTEIGHADTPLEEMSLDILRKLLGQLIN